MEERMQPHPRDELPRREVMQTPEEVTAMLRLKGLGWGIKRIARAGLQPHDGSALRGAGRLGCLPRSRSAEQASWS